MQNCNIDYYHCKHLILSHTQKIIVTLYIAENVSFILVHSVMVGFVPRGKKNVMK